MLITRELAETIVKRAMSIIHHNVNVIDHQGIIIASSDTQRINEKHEIALEVIKTRRRITIENEQQAAKFKNVHPGINHPIIIDDRVVLVIGVSGNPAVVSRYAELAILTAELLVQQSLEIREINWRYRIRDLLIKQYLKQGNSDKGLMALKQLALQDVQLDQPLQALLINIDTGGNLQTKTIDNILKQLSDIINSQRVILLSNEEVLLLITDLDNRETIAQEINAFLTTQLSHYRLAIGIISDSAELFRQSIFMLKEMISFSKQNYPEQRVVNSKDCALSGLLKKAESSPFCCFFHDLIKKLLAANSGRVLIETLSTFLNNNAQINTTSSELGIHRNTLSYRLHQIREITNLDPFRFDELSQLMIALHYYQPQTDVKTKEKAEDSPFN